MLGIGLWVGAAVMAAVTFMFRYLTLEFTNDHFVHLSRAFQIVRGDVPVRDFFDPGLFLQYYTSAAALRWSGHNLFGEGILTAGFIAAGSALTFVAAMSLSRSAWIATVSAALGALAMPRLYSYPKVFFYVLAIVLAWHYARRPGKARLFALAGTTAVAFLFRYDHGAYIALSLAALLAVRHWMEPRQTLSALLQCGVMTLLLLSPFLAFLQMTTGVVHQIESIAPQMAGASRVRINWLPFQFDLAAPLLRLAVPSGPRVNVRWVDQLPDHTRRSLEQKHALLGPQQVEGPTWSYVLSYEDRQHLAALVDDPAVADTHGIDRAGRKLEVETPWYVRLQHQVPLVRTRLAPGFFTRGNALAWFYYLTLLLPFAAAGLLVHAWWRGSIASQEAGVVAMSVVLCVIVVQTLVRGSPDSRLADIANPIFVVGAWVLARCLRSASHARPLWATAGRALAAATVVVTAWSVGTSADAATSAVTSRILDGPSGVRERAALVTDRLRSSPIENWTRRTPGLGGLMRYVYECTAATDRLLATWFAPQVYFYTERPFAAGQVYLTAGWHATPEDQQLSVARLERQRVPVVLENGDWEYERYFPIIAEHVRSRYRNVEIPTDYAQGYRVLVDPRLKPTGTYELFSLPCYR